MTCAILARCAATGQLGVGVVSSLLAVTGRCAFVQAQVGAVVVQSMADPRLGPAALKLLAGGYRPEAVLRAFDRTEEGFEYRQVALVNARGDTAVHSGGAGRRRLRRRRGPRAVPPCATGWSIGRVPDLMVETCVRTKGELGDRLIAALAGGRGRRRGRARCMRRASWSREREPWPLVDLRIDWTEGDPVAELDHLWHLWRPQMRDYRDRALDPASAVEPPHG